MLVTIAISVYNAESFLEKAINSVIQQTYKNWELIIIDDGSTDNSLVIANSFYDPRIRVISDGLNKKLPCRLNQVTSIAKGNFIARMDADDLMSVHRIEKQVRFLLNNPEYDLVTTGLCSISDNCEILGVRYPSPVITPETIMLGKSGIVHASVLAKKDWFERNKYNEESTLCQDYELWLNASMNDDLKIGVIREPLYYYREQQNITITKILGSYSQQINIIINKFSDKRINKYTVVKSLMLFRIKQIVAYFIFQIKRERYLLTRRSGSIDQRSYLYKEIANSLELLK